MPFLKSHAPDAGVRDVFENVADLFEGWTETGERLYRGPSAFSPGDRELMVSFVSALNACQYCFGSHSQIALAWGVDLKVLDALMEDIDSADISPALKPVFHFIRKLTLEPARMTQKDANAVLAAGWDERAYHEMVVLCCRMNFMNRLSEGFGLAPPDPVMMKDAAARLVAQHRT
jgi:uncharacterized peroxidase-related enzyme